MQPLPRALDLDELDRRLLDDFQRDFPLEPEPYAVLARRLGCREAEVRRRLRRLLDLGAISRIGAVVRPNTVGASCLAAMQVPPERLEAVAEIVNAYPQVNHNYEREHRLNLWFVVAADDEAERRAVLADIAMRTGLEVIDLPMECDYRLDLGFPLSWN